MSVSGGVGGNVGGVYANGDVEDRGDVVRLDDQAATCSGRTRNPWVANRPVVVDSAGVDKKPAHPILDSATALGFVVGDGATSERHRILAVAAVRDRAADASAVVREARLGKKYLPAPVQHAARAIAAHPLPSIQPPV